MRYILSFLGIILSFLMVKYRETFGDMMGEADWMRSVGGAYWVVVYVGIFIFFWSLAELTNTTGFLFGWLRYILPGMGAPPPPPLPI